MPNWTDITTYSDPQVVSATDWNQMVRDDLTFLHAAHGFRLSWSTYSPLTGANAVQRVKSNAGTATGGVFQLGYRYILYDQFGNVTSDTTSYTYALPWNATQAEVISALSIVNGLYHRVGKFGTGPSFTMTGTSLNGGFDITFLQQYFPTGPTLLLDIDSGLTGDTVNVTTITASDAYVYIPVNQWGFATGNDFYSGNVTALVTTPNLIGGGSTTTLQTIQLSPGTVGYLPGIWTLHGQIALSSSGPGASASALIRRTNAAGTTSDLVKGTRTAAAGQSYHYLDVRWTGRITAGDIVGLYTDAPNYVNMGASQNTTFFEGVWRGA